MPEDPPLPSDPTGRQTTTATVTDPDGDSSEFSAPANRWRSSAHAERRQGSELRAEVSEGGAEGARTLPDSGGEHSVSTSPTEGAGEARGTTGRRRRSRARSTSKMERSTKNTIPEGLFLDAKSAYAADFTVTNTNDLAAVGESQNSEFRLPNFR